MAKDFRTQGINRVIDANINRLKEGLRVCEEISRFILNSPVLTLEFKSIRHKITSLLRQLSPQALLRERESSKDVGRNIQIHEFKRLNYQDIFLANIQRSKESLRVLEEFSKLKNTKIALVFKRIRYRIYEVEKKAVKKISSLSYPR